MNTPKTLTEMLKESVQKHEAAGLNFMSDMQDEISALQEYIDSLGIPAKINATTINAPKTVRSIFGISSWKEYPFCIFVNHGDKAEVLKLEIESESGKARISDCSVSLPSLSGFDSRTAQAIGLSPDRTKELITTYIYLSLKEMLPLEQYTKLHKRNNAPTGPIYNTPGFTTE